MEAVVHLDTHVVVWLYAGDLKRIPKAVREILETHTLAISPAVVLELQYLREIKRVTESANHVVEDLAGRIDLKIDDLSFASVVTQALKLSWTRDPFDRLITAHAQARDALLVTADGSIRRHYKKARWNRTKRLRADA